VTGTPDVSPPGLDLARLAPYLDKAFPAGAAGVTGAVISGGKSNLTYRLTDGATEIVLRRPPLGHVLPSAHDMAREYRVISALAEVGFPVPAPLLFCPDADVIGAPFYLMSYVDGVVLRSEREYARLTPDTARRCGERLVDVLLDLHAVDHVAAGLGDFGRPDGYLTRQVTRWHQQWERSKTRDYPLLEDVTAKLFASVPAGSAAAVVHGDHRLDNVMFDQDLDRIVAVLDWEMATIGDPLADVGLLCVYSALAAEGLSITVPRLGPEQGFPSATELAERYARGAGVPLDRLDWYVALACYKLAIISEGIHARYLQGKTVGDGFSQMGGAVPLLVERAAAALARA
jgi:aminoglycoside phosphotransferase (APT) family kinase protein